MIPRFIIIAPPVDYLKRCFPHTWRDVLEAAGVEAGGKV